MHIKLQREGCVWTIWHSWSAKVSFERVLLGIRVSPSIEILVSLANDKAGSFCGSTSDFCGKGCQAGFGGCGPPPEPPCSGSKVGQRTIGSVYRRWIKTYQLTPAVTTSLGPPLALVNLYVLSPKIILSFFQHDARSPLKNSISLGLRTSTLLLFSSIQVASKLRQWIQTLRPY